VGRSYHASIVRTVHELGGSRQQTRVVCSDCICTSKCGRELSGTSNGEVDMGGNLGKRRSSGVMCHVPSKGLKCGVAVGPKQLEDCEAAGAITTTTTTSDCDNDTMAQSDDEDDYMNMTFEDAPKGPKYETSLQRAARLRKEVRCLTTKETSLLTIIPRAKRDRDRRPKPSAKQKQKKRARQPCPQPSPKPTRASR
jgi:hypothetical protein